MFRKLAIIALVLTNDVLVLTNVVLVLTNVVLVLTLRTASQPFIKALTTFLAVPFILLAQTSKHVGVNVESDFAAYGNRHTFATSKGHKHSINNKKKKRL